jgi:hypothetical protein
MFYMSVSRCICSIALLVFACMGSFAQEKINAKTNAKSPDKIRLSSLPEKATVAETQEWLTAALIQNSSYLSKDFQKVKDFGAQSASNEVMYTDSKISEVKFQGSVLTYKLNQAIQANSGAGRINTQSGNSLPPVPQETNSTVQLDLKDINPDEITLQEINADLKLQQLSLRTYDYKRSIRLKSPDTGTVNISVANMIISGSLGEQVQAAFIHLVKLVQEQTP